MPSDPLALCRAGTLPERGVILHLVPRGSRPKTGTSQQDRVAHTRPARAMPEIDGALVGGASLKPDFVDLVRRAVEASGSR